VATVGLTGGIGSGKSTVARLLADRGAVVIDADDVTRQLQRPGEAVYHATVERFGPEIVAATGELDRPALARLVFSDPTALADLESLTHPAVRRAVTERARASPAAAGVVLVVPLLLETGHYDVEGVVVVDCPEATAIARLQRERGMAVEDIRARLDRQLSRDERLERADMVVDNAGPPEALPPQIDRLWTWITSLAGPPS